MRCRALRLDCSILEINLDRWRALPRDFGSRYLWVNVPAQRLDLIENGRIAASHKVIIGKPGTATPLFQAVVTAATANPWWNVPSSIIDESIGKLVRTNPREAARRGYVATVDRQGKLVVRQKPGPGNALGRLKLEMPNPYGVYIHDTSTRELFARDARALSHGCIRTDQPEVLAKALLGTNWAAFDTALLLATTQTVKLPASVPVYVVYLTAEPDASGLDGATYYPDIYRRDRVAPNTSK
jgi:murein L,D-transpeptidase YcbB/YkuD